MNASLNQVETEVEAGSRELEYPVVVETIKELATIELAYVGGGIANVSFI